jgi:hypothetical protein
MCVEQDAIKMASHGGITYKKLHKKLQFGTCFKQWETECKKSYEGVLISP